jgi:hypothetical protein
MAHNIDFNKVQEIETLYGKGYAYGGTIYDERQWKKILENNADGFKRGGRKEGEMSDAENKAYNLEMGIDDASVRADEAAINATKDALEQSYSDKYDATEPDRIARYSSAFDESGDALMEEARYLAARNQARREANPVSEKVRLGRPSVAKGFFDETGDAEDAPVSLINNQTTYKKPVKKEKEEEKQKEEEITELWNRKDEDLPLRYKGWSDISRIIGSLEGSNPSKLGYDEYYDGLLPEKIMEEERTEKLNEKSRELDKLWKDYTKSHPGITSRQWYNSSVGGTADLKSGQYVEDPIVLERNRKYQKDHPEEYKSYTWNPQFRKGESSLGSSSFSKPFTGDK